MTDRTYPELDPHDTLAGTELCALHQDGRLVRLTLAELAAYIRTAETIVPASEPFRGVLLERTSVLAGVTFPLIVPWQAAAYDTNSFWSGGAATRITIPAGVTRGRLYGAASFNAVNQSGTLACRILRNGAVYKFSNVRIVRDGTSGFSDNRTWAATPVIPVTAGDFFELQVLRAGLASVVDLQFDVSTFFAFEVVERSS
jgi:hypothetical protein